MPDTATPIQGDIGLLRIDRSRESRKPGRRRRGFPWGLGITLALLGGAAYVAWPRIQPLVAGMRAVPVKTAAIIKTRPGASSELTNATGYVVARRKASVSSKLSGRLIDLRVDVGSRVKKGDLIAKLDDEIYRAAVDHASAQLEESKAEETAANVRVTIAERTVAKQRLGIDEMKATVDQWTVEVTEAERIVKREQDLMARGAGTPEAVAQAVYKRDLMKANIASARTRIQSAEAALAEAQAEVFGQKARIPVAAQATKRAEAQLTTARSNLADTELHAEFDAVVLRKEADIGEMVVPALMGGGSTRGAVVTLADFTTLEIEVDVFERDLHLVKDGAPARIYLDAYPDAPMPGKVRQVEPTADRQKATVLVKVTFDNLDDRVLPEMGGRVVFLRDAAESLAAPQILAPSDALMTIDGRRGVFVVTGDSVRFTPVKTGEERKTNVVIESGLSGGELVVVSPPAGLNDGTQIKRE